MVNSRVFVVLLLPMLLSLSACTSSRTTTGSSEVREAPATGVDAHQKAWEQGRVPKEIRKQPSATSLPPVEGRGTYTSTTAPTGEIEGTTAGPMNSAQSTTVTTQTTQTR
ncbi:MAG: hypothetical protein K0Q50_3034 [Vampirovibrio sp.]|jgi:hypothetical protein|nr:hypothetical protein [Vampirovibrio sp.]